ncbi:hypothetical protein Tco_0447277, partial [Tanacetum coccineum]
EDNGKPMDDLVIDARKKVEIPPKKTLRKTGIWSVVLSTSNDHWYFSLSSSGEFSVKDTRLAIDDLVLPSHFEPT